MLLALADGVIEQVNAKCLFRVKPKSAAHLRETMRPHKLRRPLAYHCQVGLPHTMPVLGAIQ